MTVVSGKTRVVGIIGSPVAHSLSPVMHNAAFRALGLDYVYVPFPTPVEELAAAVAGFRATGVAGFNATIPHKVALVPLLDEISPEARLVGAVNTVAIRDRRLLGYNTDGIGLLSALSLDLDFTPKGRSILLLGAGGAARSALYALADAGARRIAVANRSAERGGALVAAFKTHFPGVELSLEPLERLQNPEFLPGFDCLVNTSSVGMKGESFPHLELSLLNRDAVVYDMVYSPRVTPLLARAAELGLRRANGIGMLVAQGEAAFEIFTGTAPPHGLMRRTLMDLLVGR
jgi:shikimate dehydrogenase